MFRTLCTLAFALLVVAPEGQAQDSAAGLVSGRRIRIHQKGAKPVVGELVSISAENIKLTTSPADTVLVPRSAVSKIDLYMGTKSGAGHGALTGFLVGAAGGALMGVAASGSDDDEFLDFDAGELAATTGVLFGAIGAGVGAIIGSGSRRDRWTPTVLPTAMIVPDEPGGKRVAFGVRIRF